jgi:hypothetical protein
MAELTGTENHLQANTWNLLKEEKDRTCSVHLVSTGESVL